MRQPDPGLHPPRPLCDPLQQRRVLSGGGRDPSFSGDGQAVVSFPGSDFVVSDVALQPNGQVVVAGEKGLTGAVARLNADGTVDASFGSGGLSEIFRLGQANGVALQPDGRILVAGTVDDHFAVVRLLPGGSLDESFANHGVMRKSLGEWSSAYDLAIQPDGRRAVAGNVSPAGINDVGEINSRKEVLDQLLAELSFHKAV